MAARSCRACVGESGCEEAAFRCPGEESVEQKVDMATDIATALVKVNICGYVMKQEAFVFPRRDIGTRAIGCLGLKSESDDKNQDWSLLTSMTKSIYQRPTIFLILY